MNAELQTRPREDQEVGLRRNLLRTPQFLKTDPHGAMIETGLSRDTPAQINGLELKLPARAELLPPIGRRSLTADGPLPVRRFRQGRARLP